MSDWNFPGAKWWKFDFHTHTPASTDFLKGCSEEEKNKVTPEFWLRKFMEKGIDCVAVTDHNSGDWIDQLKAALSELKGNRPPWYRPLYLFPGVEISVSGGIHVLAIFGVDRNTSTIVSLLGDVKYQGTTGGSDGVTKKSLTEVIEKIAEHGGISIPAHVDKEKGLFEKENESLKIDSNTLQQVLDSSNIYAIELCNKDFVKPQVYEENKVSWTEVCGSDTHNFQSRNFGNFTWIKMDVPSIEGLKLALIDGTESVNRDMSAKPNQHSQFVIEMLSVKNAKYIGKPEEVTCNFSPWLNAIIGSRGSGKSTLLEFMRFLLRRENDIPPALAEDSEKYFTVGKDGLLLDDSRLSLIYRKDETRYKLNWSENADMASIQVFEGGEWKSEAGIIESLFPVYIYSQKQIFALAQKPDALLDFIDKDPSVCREEFEQKENDIINNYKRSQQKISDLNAKIARKPELTGKGSDVSRQIKQIEKSGHKKVLENYRQRQQQLSAIKSVERQWQDMATSLENVQSDIDPLEIDGQYFDNSPEILVALVQSNNQWEKIKVQLTELANNSEAILTEWNRTKSEAGWMKALMVDIDKFQQIRTQLEQQNIDPEKYPQLLQQQANYRDELKKIDGYKELFNKFNEHKKELLTGLHAEREKLTESRKSFLNKILENNSSITAEVKLFGQDWDEVEQKIRTILQCPDRFDRDFLALKGVYADHPVKIDALNKMKDRVVSIRNDKHKSEDNRFATHIKNLPEESISDLMCWFPNDNLEIKYRDQNIRQGSPGQKTAALLAVILSYGTEPLLLDQPEDDLDNELIYSLIVKNLREIKSTRQVIVVTHNANIVVNGNAEMVLPLSVSNGQSKVDSAGSIQNQKIREKICNVLEGGKRAFEQRYKRIHLN